jgi:hypothetical protein
MIDSDGHLLLSYIESRRFSWISERLWSLGAASRLQLEDVGLQSKIIYHTFRLLSRLHRIMYVARSIGLPTKVIMPFDCQVPSIASLHR